MNNLRRVLTSVLVIGVVVIVGIGATRAFFSDTETSEGNSFTAGEIDLTVQGVFDSLNNGTFPEDFISATTAFFAFTDLKPGDFGGGRVEMSATSNEYYACVGVTNIENLENTLLEPETEAGDAGSSEGELDQFLRVAIWNDLDDDGIYEPGNGETQIGGSPFLASSLTSTPWLQLADSAGGIFAPGPLTPGETYSIGMRYCFGEFDANLNCTGTEGNHNIAQSDSLSGDLEFYAVQSRNNDDFTCASLNDDEEEVEVGAALGTYSEPTCNTTVSGSSSIQTAVTAAGDGDVVCVDPTYNGTGDTAAIRIENAGVTLAATVQGVDLFDPVVLSASNVTVTGFDGTVGQAESPAELAAFYLDNDADLFEVSFNTITGGTGVGILTETGAALGGGLIANNVIDGVSGAGIYTNPHTGVFVIEYNDIDNNGAGIGGLMGATVRYNEFAHTVASSEAIGVDSSYDSNPASVNFNNFLDDTRLNTYTTITGPIDAVNNFWGPNGGATQTDDSNGPVDFTPEAVAAYPHN